MNPEDIIIQYLPEGTKMKRTFPSKQFLKKKRKMKQFMIQQERYFLRLYETI